MGDFRDSGEIVQIKFIQSECKAWQITAISDLILDNILTE